MLKGVRNQYTTQRIDSNSPSKKYQRKVLAREVVLSVDSLSNQVCTILRSNPNLIDSAGINIHPIANTVCLYLGIFLFWICDCQLSFKDQMGSQAAVRVWTVTGVPTAKLSALPARGYVGSRG
jgi:hypothetical protein